MPPRPVYRGDVAAVLTQSRLVRYLASLSAGRFILWCYFIWWAVVLVRYFDLSPRVWLTSLGLSVIIGFALLINTTASGRNRVRLEAWPTFRLFLTPFCVSSFAALVKGRGFFLIFSPHWGEMAAAVGLCVALGAAVIVAKRLRPVTARPIIEPAQGMDTTVVTATSD
jgi:hypothetical protein